MASPGYDGSIRIDSRIDTKNFNAGMKKLNSAIGKSMSALIGKLASVAVGVTLVVSTIATLAAGLIALGVVAAKALSRFVNHLYESLSTTSAYRSQVVALRGAFDNLKGAMIGLGANLLNAVAPALMTIIDWLVKALNFLSMFIAALSGQKTVMMYVAGATKDAASGAGKLAKNTKDAEKAAKGALAAFDEINVLQQAPLDTESTSGGSGIGGQLQMMEVEIPEDYVKNTWKSIWDWVKLRTAEAWFWLWDNVLLPVRNFFIDAWESAKNFFLEYVWTPIKETAIEAWENIKEAAQSAWNFIVEKWTQLKETFVNNVWLPIKNAAIQAWEIIKNSASNAWNNIKNAWNGANDWFLTAVWTPIKTKVVEIWDSIETKISDTWTNIKTIWGNAKSWFDNTVINPIKDGFSVALEWIKTKFTNIFDGIKLTVKGVINGIIGFLNRLLSGITTAVNGIVNAINSFQVKIPSWVPGIGGTTFGGFNLSSVSTPQIPYLAKGAVIPPNSEFLAVLGDQRAGAGKSIEAPEQLIRQIVSEELSNAGGQEVTINFAGSLGALVQELKPYIDRENIRVGKSLVRGMA